MAGPAAASMAETQKSASRRAPGRLLTSARGTSDQNRAQIKNNARNHMRTIDTGSREKQSRREGAAATVRIRRNALHNMREQQQ